VTVSPGSPDDRISELADALGLDPAGPLRLDGRTVGRHESLARAGLVRGSRLETDPTTGGEGDGPVDGHAVVVGEAGPAAGETIVLGPGTHGLGRAASATIRIADPSLEPHHGLVDVDGDGTVHFVQLSGRVPARVAGEPVAGRTVIAPGDTLLVGASRVRIGRHPDVAGRSPSAAALTPTAGDPWRRTLRRTHHPHPTWAPEPIPVPVPVIAPSRSGGAGGLAAVFTLVGAVVVAAVMRSPLFLVLGAAGALASLGMWLAGRLRIARDDRRATRQGRRDLAAFAAAVGEQRAARWRHHLAVAPTVATAVTEAAAVGADVWSRRAGHPSAYGVTLGWGPVTWTVALDCAEPIATEVAGVVSAAERFDDAPVPVDLGPGASLAIRGPIARAVVQSLIVQLATWTGPADWRLVVVAGDPEDWDWCRWLPHVAATDGASLVIAADDTNVLTATFGRLLDGDGRHVVVVTDRSEVLALRTGPVRGFLVAHPSAAVVAEVSADDPVPALCGSALEIGSIGTARWRPDTASPAQPGRVHVAGVTTATARRVARRLAGLHDPEDPAAADRNLPAIVTLSSLNERHGSGPIDDAIAIAACWRSGGPDPPPAAAIGLTGDGVVEIDLAHDGPHALIAGTTGSGKSELLRTLVAALAARSSPDHVTFVLVDYKGGATFDACADLPHTAGVVTDLDERLAARALVSLEAELRRRERLLRSAGADDLRAYRAVPGQAPLPRLVVVIDEFATLAAELPQFLASLVGVAQRGRSLGLHLVLATQRPAGVVDDEIRANTNLRIGMRLQDPADGRDVVGDPAPASFPRGTPGRAMLRLGPGETVVFQAARSGGNDLDVLVRSIRQAAALSDVGPLHRPWLPPLPGLIGPGGGNGVALAPGDAGVLDDPAAQSQRALRWQPEDGHLALLGGRRAGTTTALRTLVATLSLGHPPAHLHAYVIDAGGDHRLDDLEQLASCGAVLRPHERERLGRLLRRLVEEIDARRRAGGRGDRPRIVLAIDGFPQLAAALEGVSDELGLLGRIVAEGAALGVVCVLTAARPGALPVSTLAACHERWLFRLDDPAEAPLCGVPAVAVAAAVPGRVVVASTGLEAQLAVIDARPGPLDAAGGGPPPVDILAVDVDAAGLPRGRLRPDGETELVVGTEFHSLGPATLTVPDGEHVLVAGPPRSGRSTTLIRLAESWREAHPGGVTHAVAPMRRSPLAARPDHIGGEDVVAVVDAVPEGCPCLVVIDDAERVDDASGAIAALVADRRPGLLVIAAGRPDGLRVQYGHWTNVIRRSRTGLLMSSCADTEGDVLGELLPRRPPIPPRPGLAWVVSGGVRALAQVGRRRS
jgi:S-DNA-T family DNA segregation ATPase FtsK/SpoIIIE